jgi:hypothetical protein
MGSPVDGMARDSETVPVPARYMYDLRTLLWHRSKLDTLCDYIGEKYQKINVSQTIAQHRIPLVLENVWPNFARSEERSFHGNDYQTMLFDGALIFGDGRCYLGTYEISMPLNDANLVVHRFFKIGRGCTLHGLSSMLPERGEHERRVMCKRHVYTVYENDYAICIFENDSPINATYVVFK